MDQTLAQQATDAAGTHPFGRTRTRRPLAHVITNHNAMIQIKQERVFAKSKRLHELKAAMDTERPRFGSSHHRRSYSNGAVQPRGSQAVPGGSRLTSSAGGRGYRSGASLVRIQRLACAPGTDERQTAGCLKGACLSSRSHISHDQTSGHRLLRSPAFRHWPTRFPAMSSETQSRQG